MGNNVVISIVSFEIDKSDEYTYVRVYNYTCNTLFVSAQQLFSIIKLGTYIDIYFPAASRDYRTDGHYLVHAAPVDATGEVPVTATRLIHAAAAM